MLTISCVYGTMCLKMIFLSSSSSDYILSPDFENVNIFGSILSNNKKFMLLGGATVKKSIFPVTQSEAKKRGIEHSSEANKNAPFPSRLRELRNGKGDSQADLAKVLGVSKSTVGLWENGDTMPDAESIYKMAKYYNVTADSILCLAPHNNYSTDEKIRIATEVTGLSNDSIKFLQYLNFHDDSDTSYAEAVNKQTISFINRVLENEGKDAKRNEYDGGTEEQLTLFMKMERYVTCSDSTTARIGESSGNMISFDEEVIPLVGTAAYFYKAALMDEIKRHLDKYRDIETGGADNGVHTAKD